MPEAGDARAEIAHGMMLLAVESNAAAAECFRRASELDPHSTESAAYLAWARYLVAPSRNEAAAAAIEELRRLIARDDAFSASCHALVARVHMAEGHPRSAAREISEALAIDADLVEAHAVWASLPEELRPALPSKPMHPGEERETFRSRLPVGRLLLVVGLSLVTFGGFAYTTALIYYSGVNVARMTRVGAEDFRDVLRLERIRLDGKRFEAVVEFPEQMTREERGRRIETVCGRLGERGFVRAILRNWAGEVIATCEQGATSLVPLPQ